MNWHEYYMSLAACAAAKSKDPNTAVGAIAVGPDGEVRSTGFNGLPRGVADLSDRMKRPAKYIWTSHAEENLVAHAARVGFALKGCAVYVTHHPCSRCARLLIQAGVAAVVIGPGTTSMPQEEFDVAWLMFAEAGVNVSHLEGPQ